MTDDEKTNPFEGMTDQQLKHRQNVMKAMERRIDELKFAYYNAEQLPIEQVKLALGVAILILEGGTTAAQMMIEIEMLTKAEEGGKDG